MDGMVIEPELGFAFILRAVALSLCSLHLVREGGVLSFYNSALANLGWVGGNGCWQRGEKSLSLAGGYKCRPALADSAEPELGRKAPGTVSLRNRKTP